jgi:lysophospholipase L1-like esterase
MGWLVALYMILHRSTRPDVLGRFSWPYFAALVGTLVVALLLTEANLDRGWPALRAARGPAVLVAASTVFTLLLVEALLRLFDPLGLSYFSESSRYILDRLPDPELKYRHRPNFESTYQGVSLRFNELGLRDDPVGPKPPGEYRILCLGDSQTMGWGVRREDIWTERVEAILKARLGRDVRLVNSGVVSYETRQQYRFLTRHGWAMQPDMLFVMYMDNDIEIDDRPYDPWGEASFEGKSLGERAELVARRTRLYQLFYFWNLVGIHRGGYDPRQVALPFGFSDAMRRSEGWTSSMEHLRMIRTEAEERGVKLAVAHFDWMRFPFSEQLHRSVREAVAPAPLAYVADWFADKDPRPYFNSTTDSHPNAEGHRIEAEHVADFILAQGWIEPALAAGSSPP